MSKTRVKKTELQGSEDDLGFSKFPICREPWESYYILRRGILPCCYGNPILAPMTEWEKTWNSAQLQEIRRHLSRGKLSPYCLESLGCPIVQRHLAKQKDSEQDFRPPLKLPLLIFLNRLFFRIPGKLYRSLTRIR